MKARWRASRRSGPLDNSGCTREEVLCPALALPGMVHPVIMLFTIIRTFMSSSNTPPFYNSPTHLIGARGPVKYVLPHDRKQRDIRE